MPDHRETTIEVCNLAELSDNELTTLAMLEITGWQEIKGGSFTESVESWENHPSEQVLGLCFVLENRPIGMTLFKRPPLSPAWVSANAVSIHGLKISLPYQRQGLGHQAFKLAIHRLKEEWPDISRLMLAVDADNAAAIAVYRGLGMTESEPLCIGRNGPEYRFEITLLSNENLRQPERPVKK